MRRTAAVVPLVALAVAGCSVLGGDDDPTDAARAHAKVFLDAWTAGDLEKAAGATDAADKAQSALAETAERLSTTKTAITQGQLNGCEEDQPCTQAFTVTMSLKSAGDWTYATSLTLQPGGTGDEKSDPDAWVVQWTPSVVHPLLREGLRLGRQRELPPRASITDRTGAPITEERPVVAIGVVPGRMTDSAAVYDVLQRVGDVDPVAFGKRVAAAKPDEFVDAVTLRQQDYLAASSQLELPGIVARDGTRSLAPTPQFARGVIGAVGPATEETLSEAGPTASSVDLVGLSGLQRVYQRQLAGTPGFSVVLVDQASEQPVGEPLFSQEPTPGQPVRTTLDTTVQNAADNALATVTKPTSLVAVDTATGGVLAASNVPNAGDNRAFTGRYPPGSTFKILSAAALVSAGVLPDTPVTCPATTTIGGKRFKNYELTSFDSGDLALAFARSCNTVFVSLADRLAAGALAEEAGLFGLGTTWDIGVPAFSGSVPEPTDAVDEAAAMIGQSKVLASPLAMAEVAAAVASGQPRAAMLVDPSPTPPPVLAPLAPALAESLRTMMRETVTEGTGSALAGLGEVHAKTGTAEYGTDVPPRTHAWLVGYRGDVAFAVIVEDGASGAEDAAPVVAAFLSALPG